MSEVERLALLQQIEVSLKLMELIADGGVKQDLPYDPRGRLQDDLVDIFEKLWLKRICSSCYDWKAWKNSKHNCILHDFFLCRECYQKEKKEWNDPVISFDDASCEDCIKIKEGGL